MNPNGPAPLNNDPNSSEQPPQTFQPFAQPPETSAPQQSPSVQPQAIPAQPQAGLPPPKKSRKGLWAIIIATSIVLVVLAALGIAAALFTNNANSAAKQYKTDVLAQLNTMLTAETPEARAKAFDTTVKLQAVPFGDALSVSYKAAKAIDTTYGAFIKEGGPIMKQRYATLDLSPFLSMAADAMEGDVSTDMPQITDTASANTVVATITGLKEKGENYVKLADRFEAYEYDQKYKADQEAYANTLREMGTSWLKLAAVQAKIADKQIEIIEAANDPAKADSLTAELGMMVASGETEMKAIAAAYPKDLSTKMWTLINKIAEDKYIQDIAAKAASLQADAERLKAEIQTLKT